MKLTLKIATATILWTIAIAIAIAFSIFKADELLIWGVVTAGAAAVVSSMVAGDVIAGAAAKHIVERIAAERDATVDRATKQMQEADKVREDRTVSRIQACNEAAMRRVISEFTDALHEGRPTPIR